MTAKGEFFPRRTNQHVPSMEYAADVRKGGMGKITIPAMVAALTAGIVALADATVATTVITSNISTFDFANMGKFGRNLLVKCSGASTAVAVINGLDYLGQHVSEQFTLNGTTDVVGKKAFASVDSITLPVAIAGETVSIGYGVILGLPYKIQDIYTELVDEVEASSAGAIVVGVDAQTATSADPRGTYAPHSSLVPNASRVYEVVGLFQVGNLHGSAHYYA